MMLRRIRPGIDVSARKYPSHTLVELEKFVAEGRGNPVMLQEIANRKAGTSKVLVTPQIKPFGHTEHSKDPKHDPGKKTTLHSGTNNWAKYDAEHPKR